MDVTLANKPDAVTWFEAGDGTRLRVADSGPGADHRPTLVLVHGWSQDMRTWDLVVAELRRAGWAGRIVRHDHRGHGGSDAAPRGTATIDQAADDLAALITDRIPDGPLVVAGHSMGGMTLMALTERHPQLVAERVRGAGFVATASDDMAELTLGLPGRRGRLVARGEHTLGPLTAHLGPRAPVTTPPNTGTQHTATQHTAARPRVRSALLAPGVRALVFGRHPRAADVLAVAEQAVASHPPSVVAFRASIAAHQRTPALDALRGTPAVVLVGDRDRLCPPRHARRIAGSLPDAEIVLLPGAGHMITYERSVEVSAHLLGLLTAAGVPIPASTAIVVEEDRRVRA